MKTITIREYGKIYEGDEQETNLDEAYLGKKAFEELESFALSNDKQVTDTEKVLTIAKSNGKKAIVAQNYIGVITLKSGISIEILPKICGQAQTIEEAKEQARILIIKMLRCLRKTPKKAQFTHVDVAKMPIFEIFIRMFADEVFDIVRRGLKCGYQTMQSNENFYKGKLVVTEQIKRNSAHKERFFVEYDEFNVNRSENKILKSTLLLLQKISVHSDNQAKLRTLISLFSEVSPSDNYAVDLPLCCRERCTEHYRNAIAWSELFLKGYSIITFKSKNEQYAKSLLFPMDKLFESYVAKEIAKYCSNNAGYSVSTQEQGLYLFDSPQSFSLRPDIVMRNGKEVFILDTKWKLIKEQKDISQADMYQMYAYHKKYEAKGENVRACCLIYPKSEALDEGKNFEYESSDGVIVKCFMINVLEIENSIVNHLSIL